MEVRLPDRIAVACPTEEEARTFMQVLAEHSDVRWYSDTAPSQAYLCWHHNCASTVYTIEYLRLTYGSGKSPKERHIPIISMEEFLSYFGLTYLAEEDDAIDLSGLL